MIRRHDGIAMAEIVIAIVNKEISVMEESSGIDIIAEAFDNCREQGLCFRIPQTGEYIAITNHRNTDGLISYRYDKPAYPTNLPVKGCWEEGIKLIGDDYITAADWILNKIRGE